MFGWDIWNMIASFYWENMANVYFTNEFVE